MAVLKFVPSRGIEPRLQDPQSCVLSVERRGHTKQLTTYNLQLITVLILLPFAVDC